MRILLPTLHVRRSAQAIPLAAGNIKACLPQNRQQTTALLDLFPEQSPQQMQTAILRKKPQLLAFPLYLWNRTQVLHLCRTLRQQHPDLYIIAGGPEASADAAAVIEEGHLDGVICGEGELAFAQLIEQLTSNQPKTSIPGFLAAGAENQRVVQAVCPDLSELPSPWLTGTLPLQPGAGVLWEVARGCRFNCAFCYDAKGQQGVRPLPQERLQQELQLFAANKVAQIWILDSTFNAPRERGKRLLQMLIEQAPHIHFHLEAKADFLDEETAALLGQISCSVQIGLQSADPDVLTPLHRALKPEQMSRALQQLSNEGVTFGLDLIYGLPGDNHLGFCTSINYALRQQPNQIDVFPLAVLPGTELYQRQNEFGISADPHPPYLIQNNKSYPPVDLEKSERLAIAADIFYNRGRAVGFFLQLCEALSLAPAELLEKFSDWLQARPELSTAQKSSAEEWQPAAILVLQQNFIAELLQSAGQKKLQPLAEDLVNYHFCCAEVLLAQDCEPMAKLPAEKQLLQQKWQLATRVRIQKFNYDLEELEEIGGEKMAWQVKQLSQTPSYGIFLQQAGQPIIESVQDDFARILLAADGQTPTKELLRGGEPQTAVELLQFAVAQGLLQPTT